MILVCPSERARGEAERQKPYTTTTIPSLSLRSCGCIAASQPEEKMQIRKSKRAAAGKQLDLWPAASRGFQIKSSLLSPRNSFMGDCILYELERDWSHTLANEYSGRNSPRLFRICNVFCRRPPPRSSSNILRQT